MPAGALIAGCELARLTRNVRAGLLQLWLAVLLVTALGCFAFYYFGPRAQTPVVRQTIILQSLARAIKDRGGAEFPLTHTDDPPTLQIYLNTFRSPVSFERAVRLLRGPEPAFVAVRKLDVLKSMRQAGDPPLYTLLSGPSSVDPTPAVIVGNRPDLTPSDSAAFCFGSLLVRIHGARLVEANERSFDFEPAANGAEALLTNESSEPRTLRVSVLTGKRRAVQQRIVAGGETWRVAMDFQR
jgi:hypothetical protein